MNAIKILAIVLIAVGISGLIYGMVAVTGQPRHATVGSIEPSGMDPESMNVPIWAGLVAILGGGLLLFVPARVRVRS